jgi:hypothetical protein
MLYEPWCSPVALSSLAKLIGAGADIHATDSYGNNGLMRAVMDANQLQICDQNAELIEDLGRVFQSLVNAGADFAEKTSTGQSVSDAFGTSRSLVFLQSTSPRDRFDGS